MDRKHYNPDDENSNPKNWADDPSRILPVEQGISLTYDDYKKILTVLDMANTETRAWVGSTYDLSIKIRKIMENG